MKFICIAYGDQAGYDRTPPEVRDAAHRQDAVLEDRGVEAGVVGTPVQVRNHVGAGLEVSEGPYLTAELPVAGMSLLEAVDRDEAVRLVQDTPCPRTHGLVEVWPLVDPPGA